MSGPESRPEGRRASLPFISLLKPGGGGALTRAVSQRMWIKKSIAHFGIRFLVSFFISMIISYIWWHLYKGTIGGGPFVSFRHTRS